jgi:MFS family permease
MAELEAPKLMMGLSQLFECFGEAPFMFLSSWLIARIGHHGAMTMALASFCVRYIGYSLVGAQPWWILVLELFHGPGFGLFYANMATFAHNVAPSGAVATMQGVLGGIYDGFGMWRRKIEKVWIFGFFFQPVLSL